MSEISNTNYIIHTDGRIYVKLGGRYVALLDEEGNLNLKLRNTITTVNSLSNIDTEGLYYYEGNVYAWVNGEPRLLSGSGGSEGDISVVNLVIEGDLRAVTSNAVAQAFKNIQSNILPFEGMVFTSQVSFNPIQHSNGTIKFSLSLKCFVLEDVQDGVTRYFTNWKGCDAYQIISSDQLSNIQLRSDVIYLDTASGTLYIKGSSNNLKQIITLLDMDNYISKSGDLDEEVTLDSVNVITSGAVYNALSKIGAVEFFNGITSVNDVLELVNGTYSGSTYLIIYSHYYKTFVARVSNQSLILYYKKWQTSNKFLDEEGNPNKNLIYVYNNTLYIWNNELIEVVSSSSGSDSLVISIEYMIEGSSLPIPDSSNLGKFAITYNNSIYSLYQAEDVNNTILYIPKQFSINKLYINNNKLYLWNGEELVEVGKSNFKYKTASFYGILDSVTVRNQSYSGLDGDIIYVNNLNKFVCRVLSLGNEIFYSNWSNSELYFNEGHTSPRTDIIYINDNTAYVYDGELISIGGAGSSGSADGQRTIDTDLNAQSYNAISNSTVTKNLNNLSLRIGNLEGSAANSNIEKSNLNELGTYYVSDLSTPVMEENTKYVISKNIIGSEDIINTSGTATFYISDDGSNLLLIYATYYLNNKPWVEGDNSLQLGKQVIICGKLSNSNGTIRTSPKKSYLYSITNSSGDQSSQISGAGTLDSPFNVAAANDWANELELGEESQLEFYIKGTILNIVENFTLSKLILPTGSKIVPNGGIPTVEVVGGEMSWVHSSDIGMLQDDKTLSYSDRLARGQYNKEILEKFVTSRYNLILDGSYFIDTVHDNAIKDVDAGIPLRRPLEIQNGKILADNYLFSIGEGGSFKAVNTTFEHVTIYTGGGVDGNRNAGYPMFVLDARSRMIDHFILDSCTVIGGDSVGGKFGTIVKGLTNNVRCSSSNNMVYKQWKNEQSLREIFDLDENEYTLDSKQTSGGYAICYMPNGVSTVDDDATNIANALYAGSYEGNIMKATTDVSIGEEAYQMNIISPPSPDKIEKEDWVERGIVKYGVDSDDTPIWCTFEKITVEEEGTYYLPVEIEDECEAQGINSFILKNCLFTKNCAINFGNMMVKDVLRVEGCHFKDIQGTAINYGASNSAECATEWTYRSCPFYILNNIFEGIKGVYDMHQSGYRCAVLCECPTVYFQNNTVRNIMATFAETYDSYLTAQKVFYENNLIENVVLLPCVYGSNNYYMNGQGGFEWGKSKQANGTLDWKTSVKNGEIEADLERVYRNNRFCITKSAWEMAKDYMLNNYSSLVSGDTPEEVEENVYNIFVKYALKVRLSQYVTSYNFKRVLWDNNQFYVPDGLLAGTYIGGVYNKIEEFSFCNNTLLFKDYYNLSNCSDWGYNGNNYKYYIFSTAPIFKTLSETVYENYNSQSPNNRLEDVVVHDYKSLSTVKIDNNKFLGGSGNVMNLFCQLGEGSYKAWWTAQTSSQYYLENTMYKSFSISNNLFENVYYRCGARYTCVASSDSYNGDIRAESITITGNTTYVEDTTNAIVGNDVYGSSNAYYPGGSIGSYSGEIIQCDSLYTYVKNNCIIDTYDYQTTAASSARTIKFNVPENKLDVKVRSRKLIRPTTVVDNVISNDLSLKIPIYLSTASVAQSLSRVGDQTKGFRIRVTYTKGGEIKSRLIEVARSRKSSFVWSIRDANSIRYGYNAGSAENYTWQKVVEAASEIGLYLHVKCVSTGYKKMGYPIILSFYTGSGGTTNDLNTEILIEVSMLDAPETVDKTDGTVTGSITPMEAYIPAGSLVSESWRNATNQYLDPTSTLPSIMAASDAGYWVIDENTLDRYYWTGTEWRESKNIDEEFISSMYISSTASLYTSEWTSYAYINASGEVKSLTSGDTVFCATNLIALPTYASSIKVSHLAYKAEMTQMGLAFYDTSGTYIANSFQPYVIDASENRVHFKECEFEIPDNAAFFRETSTLDLQSDWYCIVTINNPMRSVVQSLERESSHKGLVFDVYNTTDTQTDSGSTEEKGTLYYFKTSNKFMMLVNGLYYSSFPDSTQYMNNNVPIEGKVYWSDNMMYLVGDNSTLEPITTLIISV